MTEITARRGSLTPSGLDEIVREHGGRPMTREERREFDMGEPLPVALGRFRAEKGPVFCNLALLRG